MGDSKMNWWAAVGWMAAGVIVTLLAEYVLIEVVLTGLVMM